MSADMDVSFDDEPATPAPAPASRQLPAPRPQPAPIPTISGRTPPHSLEAEEYLLSCILLDGADVLAKCTEAHVTPRSFYLAAHSVVFDCLLSLQSRGEAIDIAVLAEELKSTKQLASVGGFGFLTQISSRIPTIAQAGYFVQKVRELHVLRELIRSAAATVEECYSFSGDIDGLLELAQDTLKSIASSTSQSKAEQIAARAYDPTRIIPKPTPIYTLDGTTVSTPGNLTAIYSQAKTGKSSLIGAMIAATMTNPASGHDTLGVVGPNYAKHAVLHFDTEQSHYDWQQLITSSLRRVGMKTPPDWLMSYTLTGMGAAECREFIEATIKRARKLHGGIHSIIIDGIADLVTDPNDAEDCFPLITRLHAIAIEQKTAVISILHMNPGSETAKGRGHLGSQLERKAESNLTIEKDANEVSRVYGLKQRGKAITKDKAHCFQWSEKDQMHMTCGRPAGDGGDKPDGRRGRKYEFSEFRAAIPAKNAPPLKLPELGRIVRMSVPIKDTPLYDVLQGFVDDGLIEVVQVGPAKAYRMAL